MLALFILLLQHASLISAATPFIPALKTEKEQGQAMIRGLIELGNRQSYYCPAPSYACVYPNRCCLNSLYQCCRGERYLIFACTYASHQCRRDMLLARLLLCARFKWNNWVLPRWRRLFGRCGSPKHVDYLQHNYKHLHKHLW